MQNDKETVMLHDAHITVMSWKFESMQNKLTQYSKRKIAQHFRSASVCLQSIKYYPMLLADMIILI